jgi:hypothetical protein
MRAEAAFAHRLAHRLAHRFALMLILALLFAEPSASTDPAVFIANASAARVKALALDTALQRGWTLVESNPDQVLFETQLDQPASAGPAGATAPPTTQLRIQIRLQQTSTGTLVSASAEEHWWMGTERAWSSDVTKPYKDNLQRALRSLQQRWQSFAKADDASSTSARSKLDSTGNAAAPAEPLAPYAAALQTDDPPIGLWAYYAERYAQSRGCRLADRGAVLAQQRLGAEIHRVYCSNQPPLIVRCDQLGCGPSG